MIGEKQSQGLSFLFCFCGYFLSFLSFFDQKDFLFLFWQKNGHFFPSLKQLTLSVINMSVQAA